MRLHRHTTSSQGFAVLAWLIICATSTTVVTAGQSSSLMDISGDGTLLACSNRDSGTVTIVNLKTHKKLREIEVGSKPEGVTFIGDSHRLATAVYVDDTVVFLDADSGKIEGKTAVFDEPYGIVSNRSGTRLFVTLEFPGQIAEVDAKTRRIIRTHDVARFPRGIALTSDERLMLVTEYYTAAVIAVDVETGKETDRWNAASTDNLARQIVVHPTRPKVYLPHIRSKTSAAHGAGSIFPYIGVVDLEPGKGRRRKRIPMDAFVNNLVTANPWEVAVSPDGKSLYVVFSGTNDMFACEVLDDNYREINYRGRLNLGSNPRAVRVSNDSSKFYVYNALDFAVAVYDARRLSLMTSIPVTANPLGEEILLGKKLFYTANAPMTSRRWISCSSCHPDGDPDGRTWSNPEGLRNTPPLFGLAWTHPQHWSADRDETQDFEHTIRGQLMQGRGLVSGKINPTLGATNKGLSKPLDALAAYTNSHKVALSPFAKTGLSEAAKRGKEIFYSAETKCASCHSGPFLTDSNPLKKPERHDVGTGNDDPGEKMGPTYDTPMLLGVYRTAPYLHHGKAATLAEVLTKYNPVGKHGKTKHLAKEQIDDLVEFLKALPYEDPEPLAKAAGLKKVER